MATVKGNRLIRALQVLFKVKGLGITLRNDSAERFQGMLSVTENGVQRWLGLTKKDFISDWAIS